jgi:Rps23 Pro-64 3,4-dihydroxylase Tpa1-like proline 4-hydroxylase
MSDSEAPFVDENLLHLAVRHSTKRLKGDPRNAVALRSLAECHRKLGELERAAEGYARLFAVDPDDEHARYLSALLAGGDRVVPLAGNCPAPFVRILNFLPENLHQSLLRYVLCHGNQFVPTTFRDGLQKPGIRQTLELHSNKLPIDWADRQQFWNYLKAQLSRVIGVLCPSGCSLDLPSTEFGVRAYPDGHFYRPHMDSPASSPVSHRAINFVYYFHRTPQAFTGGELLLFDTDVKANTFAKDRFTRVTPDDNSIIFFPSAYWHAVLPVHSPSKDFSDSRFAVNGHFFKREQAIDADADPLAERS